MGILNLQRPPDFIIGDPPYLRRWWLIPRNRWFNIYLHQFLRDDDDRALHDHRMLNISVPLTVGYDEVQFAYQPRPGRPLPPTAPLKRRRPLRAYFRRPSTAHRVLLIRDPVGRRPLPCWSLFVGGPQVREWGFWCPMGRWVRWQDFTAGVHGETVGRGCDP